MSSNRQPCQNALAAIILIAGLVAPGSASASDVAAPSDDRQNTAIGSDLQSASLDESKGARAGSGAPGQKNRYQFGEIAGVYGAQAAVAFRWYRDIDNQDSREDFLKWALQERVSAWTSFAAGDIKGYARGSMSNVDRGVGASYTGIGADVEGPSLDLGFLVYQRRDPSAPPLKITAGRQVQFVGRGLTYFAISDGFQLEIVDPVIPQKYFISRSRPRQDNIDFSVPGFDKEGDRYYYGAEWGYNAIPRLSLYGYVFGQEDEAGENPVDRNQQYHYDSFYYGAGYAASPTERLKLWGEIVGETGHGYTDGSRVEVERTDVRAWAWISGGKYRFDLPMSPTLDSEVAYGSGDPDRILVTTTVNGSADKTDSNFLYFGYYAAGYALQPRLSNLYIYSSGFSLQPLSGHKAFEKFLIGGKAYKYFKDEKDGGTSDFESAGRGESLGNEWDAYVHWQVTESILWSVRYGIFIPSKGFPPDLQDPTQFFFTQFSWDL